MVLNPIDVQRYLKGADYPASRGDLVELARSNNAPDEIVEGLESLPDDQFSGPDQVMAGLS